MVILIKFRKRDITFQNEYLNDSNDKLMQANIRLREYLVEINGHY